MHSPEKSSSQPPCDLEEIMATNELELRPSRVLDPRDETDAVLALTHNLSEDPLHFFDRLGAAALKLSMADSTGISLLNENGTAFVWPSIAGKLRSFIGGGTPRDFGPCGTVLDRQAPILFLHPERHFTYLASIKPPLVEVLLIPFYSQGTAVGTIWAVLHSNARHFDNKDRRLLTTLSGLAASAYHVLEKKGELIRFRRGKNEVRQN